MRLLYYLGFCLGFLGLCPQSQAQENLQVPEGTWIWADEDSRETLKIEGDQVHYVSDESLNGETPENFTITRQHLMANPDEKGRLVLVPQENEDLKPGGFYILEFQNILEGVCNFSLVPDPYESEEEALNTEETQWYSRVFLNEIGYEKAVAMPTLPEPSEEEYIHLLDQIIERLKAFKASGKGIEQNSFMITFMVEQGYNPFSSKDVFVAARHSYEDSEKVKERFEEILRITRLAQN